jgi:HEAT repeat protein
MFDEFPDRSGRTLVVDMLASAGTPQAQALLCKLLSDPAVRESDEYAGWVQRFTFLWRPEATTVQFLLDEQQLARATSSRNRQALLYPIGTVAGRIAATDPIAAASLRVRLRDELAAADDRHLRIAALAGLGNAAAAEDLELVLAHELDDDPGVRGTVASALRNQPDRRASAALFRLAGDADPFVASAAVIALDHGHTERDAVRLAAVALAGGFAPEVAGRLTSALLVRRDDDPLVRTALLAMRARTTDPRERGRIDATLAAG